jgi:hypothetical protein
MRTFVTNGPAHPDLARIVELVTVQGLARTVAAQRVDGPATAPRQEVNVIRPEVHARFLAVLARAL